MRHLYFTQRLPGTRWTRAASKSRRESGLSLIEVLVAIALLTIGVLSVIILFPAGFLTLDIAANATNADRIGQSQLEKLNSTNSGQMAIIESIYSNYDAALDPSPGSCTASVAGSPACANPNLTLNATLPPNQPIALGLNNDIDAYRLVKGETVRIPPARTVTVNGGTTPLTLSLYTPAFAPIVSPSNASVAGQPGSVFAVHGLPWQRRAENSGGPTAAPDYGDPSALLVSTTIQVPMYPVTSPSTYTTAVVAAPQYLIDYTYGMIAVPQASYTQTVLFQITDGTATGTYPAGVTYHVSVTIPATLSGQWIDPFSSAFTTSMPPMTMALPSSTPLPTTGEPLRPWKSGSDILSRDFQCVNQATPTSALTTYSAGNFSADPYQYQIYSCTGTVAGANSTDNVTGTIGNGDVTGTSPIANLGTIAFNPMGAAIKDSNGRPLMASIDYEVYDWHIISEGPNGIEHFRLSKRICPLVTA